MAEGARVESIDALKHFRVVLLKFAEIARVALGDAESDMQHTLNWLEGEQRTHWQSELRKRAEAVERAKEAVRMKKMFKDSSGRTPSAVEEEKALAIAMRRVEEAGQKLAAVGKYTRVLQREIQNYKGSVQRFATSADVEIPVATAHLDSMIASLEAYVAMAPTAQAGAASATAEPTAPPPPVEQEPNEDEER